MKRDLIALIAMGLALVSPAYAQSPSAERQNSQAQPRATRETLWTEASRAPGATITEFPEYTLIMTADHVTRYYFSKPSNKSYPCAIKLALNVTYSPGVSGETLRTIAPETQVAESSDIKLPASAASDAFYAAIDWSDSLVNAAVDEANK